MGYEIDFLQVGSGEKGGDAIAIRFGDLLTEGWQRVVVVDGGFTTTGETMVQHIKEYYNTSTVDLLISTHPDQDHVAGLATVIQELTVRNVVMHRPWLHTDATHGLFVDGRVTPN